MGGGRVSAGLWGGTEKAREGESSRAEEAASRSHMPPTAGGAAVAETQSHKEREGGQLTGGHGGLPAGASSA